MNFQSTCGSKEGTDQDNDRVSELNSAVSRLLRPSTRGITDALRESRLRNLIGVSANINTVDLVKMTVHELLKSEIGEMETLGEQREIQMQPGQHEIDMQKMDEEESMRVTLAISRVVSIANKDFRITDASIDATAIGTTIDDSTDCDHLLKTTCDNSTQKEQKDSSVQHDGGAISRSESKSTMPDSLVQRNSIVEEENVLQMDATRGVEIEAFTDQELRKMLEKLEGETASLDLEVAALMKKR